MPALSAFELERYSRQVRIDGFGVEGQRRLKASSVLISRVGGVGGTIVSLLVRAGVGRVVVAHPGVIVPEYLNRWLWAGPADLGKPVTEVLTERLKAINPDVEVLAVPTSVCEAPLADLVSQVDLIADGAPLFEERYAMNQEAVRQRKPLVTGAMFSTEGYVTTIIPGETPCLACVYPEKPDYWTSIEVFPAIGPGPVTVGTTVAMEAIKVLTGFGQPLKHVLWFFDLETTHVRRLSISRRADCAVCGGLSINTNVS
jgi:molybdopterin/thiamine biosynthesis adenylyltransferase